MVVSKLLLDMTKMNFQPFLSLIGISLSTEVLIVLTTANERKVLGSGVLRTSEGQRRRLWRAPITFDPLAHGAKPGPKVSAI